MLISLALHLILLMFELLACDKLESGRHLWILVFIPLLFISIASIAVCVWAVKHDRAFEVILLKFNNCDQIIYVAHDLILAGAFLRCQHPPVCLYRPETWQFGHVEMGSGFCPSVGVAVYSSSWCVVCHYFCCNFTTCTWSKSRTAKSSLPLGTRVHVFGHSASCLPGDE